MKINNKLGNAILIVVAIGILTVGTTYSYWQWRINSNQEVNVEFTVENSQEGLYASLEGNGITEVEKLKPTLCTDKNNIVFKEININYKNKTTQTATVTATLKITDFNIRDTLYVPTSEQLKYLRYALTTKSDSCLAEIAMDINGNEISGNFSELIFEEGKVSNLPLTLINQSFNISSNITTEEKQTYYLWIWLDSTYEHENVGAENTDPLQGLNFSLNWTGTIEQNAF